MEKARERWERCIQIDPNHTAARHNLATITAELGDIETATRMVQELVRTASPPDPDNYKTLAILLFKQDLHEESVEQYRRCIELDSTHGDCYCGMGNSLIKIGRTAEALDAYTAPNNVGNLLTRHHRFNITAQTLAIEVLSRAVALDHEYADGHFNLGEAFSAVTQHEQAVKQIRIAMQLDPTRVDYKCTLHLDMRKLCDWESFEEYETSLDDMWREGIPQAMQDRTRRVATRKPGEKKSRQREKEISLCPNPLDSL
eukprot:CAMPEP_0206261754 /NCGR_PEP_ID=MMETSP0047_2-20121206/27834_1 /ASSEMBLY_ACC=CAM_ASM_000192 /TAXON_ID=195065 /ORGANISM="Chroomonas mesostigmatica_cf, Strain CCMP1168" /LENGTH=256 /DNA_ID=CAMNT_0053689011 /DNA_START=1 /DNA_END=768 /DNA_ORIENTATION=+